MCHRRVSEARKGPGTSLRGEQYLRQKQRVMTARMRRIVTSITTGDLEIFVDLGTVILAGLVARILHESDSIFFLDGKFQVSQNEAIRQGVQIVYVH